jgi:hypothetical protein
MGALIGDTIVLENGGPYVEYSRTFSHIKYQPEKVGIAFNCPKDVPMSDALFLAEQITNARLGLKVEEPRRVDALARKCLGEPLEAFRRQSPPQTKKVVSRRYDLDDDGYEPDDSED